jgi:hypothetical protein
MNKYKEQLLNQLNIDQENDLEKMKRYDKSLNELEYIMIEREQIIKKLNENLE